MLAMLDVLSALAPSPAPSAPPGLDSANILQTSEK